MIQVFKPFMDEEEWQAIKEPIMSGWIGLGPKVEEFEQKFAQRVGAKYAIATNSGTAALHLACLVLGLCSDHDILVPTMTFVSTAHAPTYVGAQPIFVDIERDTLCIDVEDAELKITKHTKAIIPVHYGGHACKMDEIWFLAEAYGLFVIEDAAHACGTSYNGNWVGGLGKTDLTCFSFHAVKNLATPDGGMITTNDKTLAARLREWRWCGIDKSTWARQDREKRYSWEYDVKRPGYKCHMNDIAAAIGLVQLGKLDWMNRRRREIARIYNVAFWGLRWLKTPREKHYTRSSWHNYVIKTPYRDALHDFLAEREIQTGVHYKPVHLMTFYRDPTVSLPVAEEIWPKLLTLPLYAGLSNWEVAMVIDAVLGFGRKL